jgi:hypothetical protein
MKRKKQTHLRLVGRDEDAALSYVAEAIRPLPAEVAPSASFRLEMRRRLLQLRGARSRPSQAA